MKIRAIKECPNQSVGTVFDAPDMAAKILIDVGAAEAVTEDGADDQAPPVVPAQAPAVDPTKKRRQYRRRDLTPEK